MRYAAILLCLVLAGCSGKYTSLKVDFDGTTTAKELGDLPADAKVYNVFVLYAPGFSVETATEQKTDGQVPISLYGANSATGDQTQPNANYTPQYLASVGKGVIDVIEGEPATILAESNKLTVLNTYETGVYEDGRARYLFRGTMEELPSELTIRLNGKDIYKVVRTGNRWQGPNNIKGANEPLLKNSEDRKNSITLLLPSELSKGKATLVY